MSLLDSFDDAYARSRIASKMPTPPPRPSSIASSTRSSKRSSVASSSYRQSRFSTMDFEATEAPPTPSISNIYTGASLGDELNQSNMNDSPPSAAAQGHADRSPPMATSTRARFSSHGGSRRRNSRQARERDLEGPSIVIGVRSSASLSPQLSRTSSRMTSLSHSESAPQLATLAMNPPANGNVNTDKRPSRIQRLALGAQTLCMDVIKAWYMLLSAVVWPISWSTIDAITSLFTIAKRENAVEEKGLRGNSLSAHQSDQIAKSFAEAFKYIVCTSSLLTSTLSISSYDQVRLPPPNSGPTEGSCDEDATTISSTPSLASVSLAGQGRPTLHLTEAGKYVFQSTIWALAILTPLSKDRHAWAQSSVLLVGLVWGAIAHMGIDKGSELTFEVTRRPTGSYRLCKYDQRGRGEGQGEYLSAAQARRVKEERCSQVVELVKACKSFDVDCNKAIAAVQEVELVSRGFKLTHPLPPISRIEASKGTSSPPRLRNASWASPGGANNASRLSRSSSSGASAASGRKHHGTRPLSNGSSSPNGRSSPLEADGEPIRMASLRRLLQRSFDEARTALQSAVDELEPLVDKGEMELLQEMYDLNENQGEVMHRSVHEPWTAPAASSSNFSDQRASWTPISRLRYDDDHSLPTPNEGNPPTGTPHRLSLLSDGTSTVGGVGSPSTTAASMATPLSRKRDSGLSETWSVASPSRDSQSVRGGSRLSYVSDKTPSSSTPNQTGALKRQSYVSASGAPSPLQAKSLLLPQQPYPVMASPASGHAKRASLLNIGFMEDHRQANGGKREAFLIASLKTSFEGVHLLRRRVFCLLLALHFTLKSKLDIGSLVCSSLTYWAKVARVMRALTSSMGGLAELVQADLQREMRGGKGEGHGWGKESKTDDALLSPLIDQHQSAADCGARVEGQLTAMGQALRSVQVKMRAAAEEMKLKMPPSLHGTSSASQTLTEGQSSPTAARQERSEKIMETIREDLLMLSAEWEIAMKLLRTHGSPTPTSAVGDTTASTMNSSRLDSPQEAEEDALRQWIKSRRRINNLSDSSDDERESYDKQVDGGHRGGMEQWGIVDSDKQGKEQESLLYDLLLHSTSPDHLPPPGLEKVYESMGEGKEAKMRRSGLSREERIRLAKEQRVAKEEGGERASAGGLDASTGIIQELQSVMKNRKTTEAGQPLTPSRLGERKLSAAFAF